MIRRKIILLIIILAFSFDLQQTKIFAANNASGFEIYKAVDNGDDYNKLVFVIMGDGYKKEELTKFNQDANNVINAVLNEEPFKQYKNYINFYLINVISNDSGSSPNRNEIIDTYFGSCFNYAYDIERLVYPTKEYRVYEILNNSKIEYDYAIIIVNSDKYGGAGGERIAVTTANEHSGELLLHELGHTLGGLSDEYFAGDYYTKEAPNLTKENNPNLVKWRSLIGKNGIGIYKMEDTVGWYIPSENCKMNKLYFPFCDVCKDQLKNKILSESFKEPAKVKFLSNKTDITNKDVEITLEFPTYAIEKRYSTDNGQSWKEYSGPIKLTQYDNLVAKYRTSEGVWSETYSYSVSNIKKDNLVKSNKIKLNKTSLTLKRGSKYKMVATVLPDNATNKKVTWTSSNSKIVKVDQNGNITAINKGIAIITAQTAVGGCKATCKVVVK